jgi:hypothetical protein
MPFVPPPRSSPMIPYTAAMSTATIAPDSAATVSLRIGDSGRSGSPDSNARLTRCIINLCA